jgi:acetoin utilization deacetylase AcuC-like enzyme
VVNDRHDIHHVRERGYVEAPVRVERILAALEPTGWFERMPPKHYGEQWIRAVHDGDFVDYLKAVCQAVGSGRSVYPYVFPVRNAARPPKDLPVRAGYYCIDTFTPLNGNAFLAARRAVDCALTAADQVLGGRPLAYALVRPPGHHAEKRTFGGFCYFNTASITAHYLSRHGAAAVLDLDYHHGNGTQTIFYERADVLTVSIHGHPSFAYPYFTGFADETGAGAGEGFNLNLPQPEQLDGAGYGAALDRALRRVRRHKPAYLVVALGLDPAKGDPTGTWSLGAADFEANGEKVGALGVPAVVVQEGGYRTRTLGTNARAFFAGLTRGGAAAAKRQPRGP